MGMVQQSPKLGSIVIVGVFPRGRYHQNCHGFVHVVRILTVLGRAFETQRSGAVAF
jgi:hypothetical protein